MFKSTPQRGRRTPGTGPSAWLRLLTLLCATLIGVASTAQVCHSHEEGQGQRQTAKALNGKTTDSKTPGQNEPGRDSSVRCPLCVAMHSTVPVAGAMVPVAMVLLGTLTPEAQRVRRRFEWRFEMASRPPPALPSRA